MLQPPTNITSKLILIPSQQEIYLPADCSFTTANAWDTVEKRASDATATIQNISVMTHSGRQPTTFQISFTTVSSINSTKRDIFDELMMYESVVGKSVRLIYANYDFGKCIVSDGTFAISNDGINGIYAINVSFNIKESSIYTPSKIKDIHA